MAENKLIRESINRFLVKATGYGITHQPFDKTTPQSETSLSALRKEVATLRKRMDEIDSRATRHDTAIASDSRKTPGSSAVVQPKQTRSVMGKSTSLKFPKDFDEQAIEIIKAVQPYTMTGIDKLHALISTTRYVARYNIPGDIVECGVWRGGSMHVVARVLDYAGIHDRELYLYDTFEGMTPPTAEDVRFDGEPAEKRLANSDKQTSMVWAYASLEDVRAGFAEVPYPAERLHFVKGPVEQTIPKHLPEKIAILRLDTDWYESTDHELKHMYDRLVPGGVLMIDDYGWWQGSRKATDEFLERTGEPLLLLRMGSGRVAVKR